MDILINLTCDLCHGKRRKHLDYPYQKETKTKSKTKLTGLKEKAIDYRVIVNLTISKVHDDFIFKTIIMYANIIIAHNKRHRVRMADFPFMILFVKSVPLFLYLGEINRCDRR